MFTFKQFQELLPEKLQCKKISKVEEITGYKYDEYYAYDENGQVYTISKDKNGNLHILERKFEEEQKVKYALINSIGRDMALSSDPTVVDLKKDSIPQISRREIVLIPSQDKTKKGYMCIRIDLDGKTYSVLANNGNAQLLVDREPLTTSSDEEKQILTILKKPFDVSLLDKLKIKSIHNTENDRLHYMEQTNQVRYVSIPITPERMREWDEAEK